jgi:hypothetical protein
VNQAVLVYLKPEQVEVDICRAEELEQCRGLSLELDEMWAYVAKKANPQWLWHAIDHHSGTVLRVSVREIRRFAEHAPYMTMAQFPMVRNPFQHSMSIV